MPETPEEFHARVAGSLIMPAVETWDTFPFEGAMRPPALLPPVDAEEPRRGEGGADCRECERSDEEFVWTNERWRLLPYPRPAGLPVVVLLEPREHYEEPGDLPDELAADLGIMLSRVERAVRGVGEIGRVHVCRYGDGSAHLHRWLMARPARVPQLAGSFAAIWDDVVPPTREDVWHANLAAVAAALSGETAGPS